MASSNSGKSGFSVGIPVILTLIFVVLRLVPDENGHLIDWSWWWVFSPLWIGFAVAMVILALVALVMLAVGSKVKKW